jgi:hypothetical protein
MKQSITSASLASSSYAQRWAKLSQQAKNTPIIDPDHRSDPGSKKILDHDRSLIDPATNKKSLPVQNPDPDGFDSQIKGKYADFLRNDPRAVLARSWKVHPAAITAGIKRFNQEWVVKQIEYVSSAKGISNKGAYLAKILKYNPY